jgi:DNA-binding LytR/AlgR family response regulator
MIKVLIVEDEQPAAEFLERMLKRIDPAISVEAKLPTVRETVAWLSMHEPELIFLDIHLADGSSFNIFDQLEVRAPIIFTTAYDQYAIRAFKVNSIDYLLKPISEEDLKNSLQKFQQHHSERKEDSAALAEILKNLGKKPEYKQRFMVYAGEKIRTIKTAEIAYFYITEKQVFLCTFEGRQYSQDQSLDKIEALLDPEQFFRINRKFIINLEAIDTMYRLSSSRIKLSLNPPADEETIVSFHRLGDFRKWLNR